LAAGGGKAGRLVAVDLPGDRLRRLRENLSRAPGIDAVAIGADIRRGLPAHLAKSGLPAEFPAVLLDAPCSNTGVIRRRVDVKWRLEEADIGRHARLQLALLSAASRFVAEGGSLVYSTCSVEPEENEGVAKAFLEGPGRRFSLRARDLARPWIAGHDGGAAFLFVKGSPGDAENMPRRGPVL
jgi:16S rRNA (cytosine967-C5)-methyltransferase